MGLARREVWFLRLAELALRLAGRPHGWDASPGAERRLRRVHRRVAQLRLAAIGQRLFRATGGVVQDGAFAGMQLDADDPDLAPKLLGCYEQEVVACVGSLAVPDLVVNVGCAGGYHAVGCALHFRARVVAIDPDERARIATREAAARNGVSELVEISPALDASGLAELARAFDRCLVVSDCEGFELELFDPACVRALERATCVIECHDFHEPDVAGTLAKRFADSHDVRVLESGPRDPGRYEVLRDLGDFDRWLAVCERRPRPMQWLVCRPRSAPAAHSGSSTSSRTSES